MKKDFWVFFGTILFAFCILFLHRTASVPANTQKIISPKKYRVVLDCGHGGFDGGKIGVDGTLEKDINLSIGLKLQALLEAQDIQVIMTRTQDLSLDSPGALSKKTSDLQNRADIMNTSQPDCIISLHQNSYSSPDIHGAQVFYASGSAKGQELADLIQQSLIQDVDPDNHRKIKENSSYFLFRNTSYPIVIVECGFLSNPEENKKLVDDSYQQRLVWAIHMGILNYLTKTSQSS